MWRVIPEGTPVYEHALLRDGGWVLIRFAGPDDVPAVESLLRQVSTQTLRMRFFAAVASVGRAFVEELCQPPSRERACLLATIGRGLEGTSLPGGAERVVGVGNFVALPGRPTAEVAFLVGDAFQGRGIGTLLLERLAGVAAGCGLVGFEAEVLPENRAMIEVFRESGFPVRQAVDGGVLHVEFPVSTSAAAWERAELRERIATANSLVPLLRPRSVAVIGASRDPESVGGMVFRYMLRAGFGGTVYPVNRQAASVHGVKAYPSARDLPEPAELAVIAVPWEQVRDVAREALDAGTRALVVLTAGFAEAGPEGAARQRDLVELVRAHGARMVGPNCLGLMNTHPEVRLNASLAPELAPKGRIGFVSHSGALGLVILAYAAERGLGFSTFVSAGNRADVSGNDMLAYWDEDPETDMALLYLETFGNPRRFARLARRLSARKPLLCVKSARGPAGVRVARAHIGAEATEEAETDALFRQAGVIRADTLEEMFDVAVLVAHQPLPAGNRVAIVSNSGGVATIGADACEARGLRLAGPGVVDLGPLAPAERYEEAVHEALVDPDVDALIAIFACVASCDPAAVARAIRRGSARAERASGAAKPVLLCLMGEEGAVRVAGGERLFPSYRFPESAAMALARAVEYAAYRRRPPGRLVFFDDADPAAARQAVEAWLAPAGQAPLRLDSAQVVELLGRFGIAVEGDVPANGGAPCAALAVRPHPQFGPLVQLRSLDAGARPAVRITPLTDRDAADVVKEANAAHLAAEAAAVAEVLLRVSHLIEELPWLVEMEGTLVHRATGVCVGSPRIVVQKVGPPAAPGAHTG